MRVKEGAIKNEDGVTGKPGLSEQTEMDIMMMHNLVVIIPISV